MLVEYYGSIAGGITTTAFINFGYLKGFEGVFIYPALLALIIAAISYVLIRDTPQSQGLPPIEIYKMTLLQAIRKH